MNLRMSKRDIVIILEGGREKNTLHTYIKIKNKLSAKVQMPLICTYPPTHVIADNVGIHQFLLINTKTF